MKDKPRKIIFIIKFSNIILFLMIGVTIFKPIIKIKIYF